MVTKSKSAGAKKKGKVKVLKLNKGDGEGFDWQRTEAGQGWLIGGTHIGLPQRGLRATNSIKVPSSAN